VGDLELLAIELSSLLPSPYSPSIGSPPPGTTSTQSSRLKVQTLERAPRTDPTKRSTLQRAVTRPIPIRVPPVVPLNIFTPQHMKRRMRKFYFEGVRMNDRGYYIIFPNTDLGRRDAERCYKALSGTLMFTHTMIMRPFFHVTRKKVQRGGWRRTPRPLDLFTIPIFTRITKQPSNENQNLSLPSPNHSIDSIKWRTALHSFLLTTTWNTLCFPEIWTFRVTNSTERPRHCYFRGG
jgi:hypothetical protein